MWIVPSVCDAARLKPLLKASVSTGMSEDAVCLFDIHDQPAKLLLPDNWTLVPSVGRLEPSDVVRIATMSRTGAGAVGILASDHLPLSSGWDQALTRAAGNWNIAYCNDTVSQGRHPVGGADHVTGAVCLGGALVREMGAMVPAGMSVEDVRIAWLSLGRALGILRYLGGVVVEKRSDWVAEPRSILDHENTDRRARLFRWLNDELRPLSRKIRVAMVRAALDTAHENRAV